MKEIRKSRPAVESPKGITATGSKKKIRVTEDSGIYRVTADFRNGFHLVPTPVGKLQLAFWDEGRLKVFLSNFGFSPVITHRNS